MAWTAPMTAVANATFLAAQFNTHVRDNLNETAPAKATTGGRIFVSTGVNAIAERDIVSAGVVTTETTTSTTYTDLTTVGPAVTVTTGTSAIVMFAAELEDGTAGAAARMGFAVSGATTIGATDDTAAGIDSSGANDMMRASVVDVVTGLTAGTNTFTAKYRVTSGTGTFKRRRIAVIAL